MSSTGEVSAADLHNCLQLLAARMSAQGHPLEAIKCYVAMLSQSMLPSDEAAVRLRLGQLMMEHTLNMQDAKVHLQKAVSRRPLADAFYVTTYQPMATRFFYLKPSFMLVASCHLVCANTLCYVNCRRCWSCHCPGSTCSSVRCWQHLQQHTSHLAKQTSSAAATARAWRCARTLKLLVLTGVA